MKSGQTLVLSIILLLLIARYSDWLYIPVLAGLLGVSLSFSYSAIKLPVLLNLLLLITSLVYATGILWNLYNRTNYYDKIAHFTLGFTLSLISGYLAWQYLPVIRRFKLPVITFVIAVGLGISWELAEWVLAGLVFEHNTGGIFEAVLDLTMDITGGIVASILIIPTLKYLGQ